MIRLQKLSARVLIFSDLKLEANLLKEDQLLGVDLPLRVRVFDDAPGLPTVIYNDFDYLLSRYDLTQNTTLREAHEDDAIVFSEVNFQKNAANQGVGLRPTSMISLGAQCVVRKTQPSLS